MIRESILFTEKKPDKSKAAVKRRSGKSKGVLLSLRDPRDTALIATIKRPAPEARPKRTCLGRINASVVRVRKKRGKARRENPRIKTPKFSSDSE